MSMPSDVTADVADAMEATGTRHAPAAAEGHGRSPRIPPEVAGFAAAALVTFLGIAVVGPRLLTLRRSTSARVDDLQRRAREAKRRADRAAAQAQAAVQAAAAQAKASGRDARARAQAQAKAAGNQARAAGSQATNAAYDAAATAGKRLRQLGGGTIRARWK